MIRKIIEINEEKCNGCGLCAQACHEGAIGMVNGKAKLLRDDYCDGLGDCLPVCPVDAIHFIEREAAAYDEEAVKANMAAKAASHAHGCSTVPSGSDAPLPCGCPGSNVHAIHREHNHENSCDSTCECSCSNSAAPIPSQLGNWPVQIRLAPVNAPYFDGADLLIAADCTAFAYGDFHNRFIKGRVTLVGCPKLDPADYSEKLAEIIKNNDIRSITLVRMQVPCCGGLQMATARAIQESGKTDIPANVVVISNDGRIISESK